MRRGGIVPMIKRLLPGSLFGRALLILIIPILLVQAVAIYVFYERHWESVTRNISASLAGELSLVVHELQSPDPAHRAQWLMMAKDQLGMTIRFSPPPLVLPRHPDPRFASFRQQLRERLGYPATVRLLDDDTLVVRLGLIDEVMEIEVSKKRLISSTTAIFIQWLTGSALIVLGIATLFLRNQIRPISRLAKAAEGFGMGLDDPLLRPAGSTEVRRATRAFLTMKARITRQIAGRTVFLLSNSLLRWLAN